MTAVVLDRPVTSPAGLHAALARKLAEIGWALNEAACLAELLGRREYAHLLGREANHFGELAVEHLDAAVGSWVEGRRP